jgi:hypothetical protein
LPQACARGKVGDRTKLHFVGRSLMGETTVNGVFSKHLRGFDSQARR